VSLYYDSDDVQLHHGDALDVARTLPDGMARTIVTSPPYFGLRDYGEEGQIGAEDSPQAYTDRLVGVFHELRRVLVDDGTLWLNLGDTYTGSGGNGRINPRLSGRAPENVRNRKGASHNGGLAPRNLLGIPWRVAFALQADGWWLRQEIIWRKPNGLPTNAPDRYESRHEHVFLLAKSSHYFFAGDARDLGHSDVWGMPTESLPGEHVAVMPPELARRAIRAGSDPGDIVLDPFSGSGTTGAVATFEGRKYIGIDLNRDYLRMSLETRFLQPSLPWEAL